MSAHAMSISTRPAPAQRVLEKLHSWSDAGLIRHLDGAFAAFIAELKETGSIQSIDEIKGRAKAALSKPEFSAFMNEFLAQQRRF